MKDGLYRVVTHYAVAGFVVKNNEIIMCAPILKKRLEYFKTIATRIAD